MGESSTYFKANFTHRNLKRQSSNRLEQYIQLGMRPWTSTPQQLARPSPTTYPSSQLASCCLCNPLVCLRESRLLLATLCGGHLAIFQNLYYMLLTQVGQAHCAQLYYDSRIIKMLSFLWIFLGPVCSLLIVQSNFQDLDPLLSLRSLDHHQLPPWASKYIY